MANVAVESVRRPGHRLLRFSVRGLVILVLLVGVWFGWLVHSARTQRATLAAITNAGGSVAYNWQCTRGTSIPGGKPWAPWWLVNLIGVDFFGHPRRCLARKGVDGYRSRDGQGRAAHSP